ncbi:hypothetical protein ABW19_dt0209997 [Dactylella cylindrospora]|nr:hypothetical protein ABW19_dt0209997 [Dactylella cylindrospora]
MDTIEVTEKQRQQLEQSVVKLRKALRHWQIHSAEYEGLKEELLALPKQAGRKEMLAIANDFGGTVITQKEITTFLGDKEGVTRTPIQVAAAVKHRIDLDIELMRLDIQGNIDQIEKQLELGETTLDNVRVIENSGQITNEEGLPVMDIREELDEKGNIIKSDVNPGGAGTAQPFNVEAAIKSFEPIVEDLAKKEKEKSSAASKSVGKPIANGTASAKPAPRPESSERKPPTKEQIPQKKSVATPKPQTRTPKRIQATEKEYSSQSGMILTEKRIKPKLVPDVKEEPPKPVPVRDESNKVQEIISTSQEPPAPAAIDEPASKDTVKKEGIARIRVIDDSDSDDSDDPFENLPGVEEAEEDAQLREEMIKFNMREMNNIVAEIELDEQGMSDDYDDDEDEDAILGSDGYEETDEEEEEDQWGRSKGQLVSNKIRREMTILQKKVEAREKAQQVADEVGSSSKPIDLSSQAEASQKELGDPSTAPTKKGKKKTSEKKGVRFAEELDIASAATVLSKPPSNPSQLIKDEFDDEDIDPSILDMVFGPGTKDQEERYFHQTTDQPKKKLPSLFKAARQVQKAKEQIAAEKAAAPKDAKKENPGVPIASDIVERAPSTSTPSAPRPPGQLSRARGSKQKAAVREEKPSEPTVVALDPLGEELPDDGRPIMTASIIERAPTWQASSPSNSNIIERESRAPDELDTDFHQREVAGEYFAMRNKLIQRQGGFVETEEEKMIVPIDENMEKKKVSRFKASRVKSELP